MGILLPPWKQDVHIRKPVTAFPAPCSSRPESVGFQNGGGWRACEHCMVLLAVAWSLFSLTNNDILGKCRWGSGERETDYYRIR